MKYQTDSNCWTTYNESTNENIENNDARKYIEPKNKIPACQDQHTHAYLATLKTTYTLLLITFLFILLFLPFVILIACISSIRSFKEHMNDIELILYQISVRLILINNVARPFVYGLTDERFRQKLNSCYKRTRNN